jgi:hypothetical protein
MKQELFHQLSMLNHYLFQRFKLSGKKETDEFNNPINNLTLSIQ